MFLSWDPDDQDKALAFIRAKESVCPSCGTREEEWEGDRFAFIADTRRCMGCELLEMEREQVPTGEHGVKFFLMKNLHEGEEDEIWE